RLQVVIHGSDNAALFNGRPINAADLARVIRQSGMWQQYEAALSDWQNSDPDTRGDRPKPPNIDLFSCNTARGFAQQLANELGVRVDAPTDFAWVHNDGRTEVAAPIADRTGVSPNPAARGGWLSF